LSGTKSDAEDDFGPHGRYPVSSITPRREYSVTDVSSRLTNDGHAILREIDVAHPAAKSMIELSRTQDEEVGDGTTSVIILGVS
jgi:chaperonin GroEL (HSP60 family)